MPQVSQGRDGKKSRPAATSTPYQTTSPMPSSTLMLTPGPTSQGGGQEGVPTPSQDDGGESDSMDCTPCVREVNWGKVLLLGTKKTS